MGEALLIAGSPTRAAATGPFPPTHPSRSRRGVRSRRMPHIPPRFRRRILVLRIMRARRCAVRHGRRRYRRPGDERPVRGTENAMAACRRSIRTPAGSRKRIRSYAGDSFRSRASGRGFPELRQTTSLLDAAFVNGSSFAHTVTGGTLPEGIRQVSSDFKTRFGLSAYVVSELLRVGNDRRYRLRIVADGEETVEDIGSFVAFSANALANEFTSSAPTRS